MKRVVNKSRNRKVRTENYEEKRARLLSARAKNASPDDAASRLRKYENLYSKFAENYANTLEALVENSKNHLKNAAKNRQKIGKNEDVANIRGRELGHFLIAQMKELPAWQIHLAKLKDELKV